jgi:four helix bundle protein
MYKSYEEMPVWQKAMDLAVAVHQLTSALPRSEDYGLTSQMRRAALSVSANLAEGFGRSHSRDKASFYITARGSLLETKSHVSYGVRIGYFAPGDVADVAARIDEIWREINQLLSYLRRSAGPRPELRPQPTPRPQPKPKRGWS